VWAVVGFSALCGLGIAVFSEFSVDSINGTGYAIARILVQDDHLVSPWFLFNKFCATLLSSVSGIPGGIFSPSLAIGAGLGADVQIWFTTLPVGILSILGMAAFLSGVVQAPLTAVVIVLEMTHDHSLVVSLMAASLIARWVAQQLGVKGVYHQLADRYIHPKT
jgi:H+/Cl- antiporter ClcA